MPVLSTTICIHVGCIPPKGAGAYGNKILKNDSEKPNKINDLQACFSGKSLESIFIQLLISTYTYTHLDRSGVDYSCLPQITLDMVYSSIC